MEAGTEKLPMWKLILLALWELVLLAALNFLLWVLLILTNMTTTLMYVWLWTLLFGGNAIALWQGIPATVGLYLGCASLIGLHVYWGRENFRSAALGTKEAIHNIRQHRRYRRTLK